MYALARDFLLELDKTVEPSVQRYPLPCCASQWLQASGMSSMSWCTPVWVGHATWRCGSNHCTDLYMPPAERPYIIRPWSLLGFVASQNVYVADNVCSACVELHVTAILGFHQMTKGGALATMVNGTGLSTVNVLTVCLTMCASVSLVTAMNRKVSVFCEPVPDSIEDGFIHVVTLSTEKTDQRLLFRWIFRLGLTRAHAFIYHRNTGRQLRTIQGPCRMTIMQRELLPDVGRETLAYYRHIMDVYGSMPRAVLFSHTHGPLSWHTVPKSFFRRARAYYRGLVGTDTRFQPMTKFPVSLTSGCGKDKPDFSSTCCHMYLCMWARSTSWCPIQEYKGTDASRKCEVKPEIAEMVASSSISSPINDLVAGLTYQVNALTQTVRHLAPQSKRLLLAADMDVKSVHSAGDVHPSGALNIRPYQLTGRRTLTGTPEQEAKDTCNSTMARQPRLDAKYDMWSCCFTLIAGRDLIAQHTKNFWSAMYEALKIEKPEQATYDQWMTRTCGEYIAYDLFNPIQDVSLADMATYLLADFALNTPQMQRQTWVVPHVQLSINSSVSGA